MTLTACGGDGAPRMALGPPGGGEPGRHAEALETAPLKGGPGEGGSVNWVLGPQPWVTVLCRFADSRTITPHAPSWFSTLMGNTYPGMDHYFREISDSSINLMGSHVTGRWYDLPQPRASYRRADGSINLDRMGQDCATAADADVRFPNYKGINFMFNQDLGDGRDWGGTGTLNIDGENRSYGMTFMPPGGYEDQWRLARRMGEALGLPSSADYSVWNMMGTCNPRGATYGCPGVHMVSYYKEYLGWMDSIRKYLHRQGTATITIEQLAHQTPGPPGPYMAKIPIAGSATQFYTVEARHPAGYDDHIPGPAVLIHRVDTSASNPARLVGGLPNDAGAMWLPGETFTDRAAGISVTVESMTATGFVVTLKAPPVQYTLGDFFNGDGKADLVITTTSGSYWYRSNGDGTWTYPYIRLDLPYGSVAYTPGDFNGDGKTDLVITTTSGSYWYFSNGDGTFTYPHVRRDLTLGSVAYTPGDFNGDGRTDLIITTSSGSDWYFSNGDGTFRTPSRRPDLTLGSVAYLPADFNGDHRTDLVITTPSGSYWYFSNGDGTFAIPTSRGDLTLGSVAFAPGDFNADGRTDLVITTRSGSVWHVSNGDGTFRTPSSRPDLTLGSVTYTPGSFRVRDGHHYTDLVVTTRAGSFWYLSNGDGTFTEAINRPDLTLGSVAFAPGDFNADGNTDLIITTRSGSDWYFFNGDGTFTVPYTRADLNL